MTVSPTWAKGRHSQRKNHARFSDAKCHVRFALESEHVQWHCSCPLWATSGHQRARRFLRYTGGSAGRLDFE